MGKKLFVAVWLLIPIVLLAVHYGPGQKGVARDQAAAKIAAAQKAERAEAWAEAVELYGAALAALPAGNLKDRFKLRLAQAKARVFAGELPEAMADMETLLGDALKSNADAAPTREVRGALAGAQYYAGWLMRLEGAATEEWMAETESSRQPFRLLAEPSQQTGEPTLAVRHQKNLEALIRLELMDLSDLKGLPLPKQCKNCSHYSSKCRKQHASNCKAPGKSQDVREQISEQKQKNAGSNGRSGTGS